MKRYLEFLKERLDIETYQSASTKLSNIGHKSRSEKLDEWAMHNKMKSIVADSQNLKFTYMINKEPIKSKYDDSRSAGYIEKLEKSKEITPEEIEDIKLLLENKDGFLLFIHNNTLYSLTKIFCKMENDGTLSIGFLFTEIYTSIVRKNKNIKQLYLNLDITIYDNYMNEDEEFEDLEDLKFDFMYSVRSGNNRSSDKCFASFNRSKNEIISGYEPYAVSDLNCYFLDRKEIVSLKKFFTSFFKSTELREMADDYIEDYGPKFYLDLENAWEKYNINILYKD